MDYLACIDEDNDIKFHNQPHILFYMIAVADYIKIQGKSPQKLLKKVAIRYTRKGLIDIDRIAIPCSHALGFITLHKGIALM